MDDTKDTRLPCYSLETTTINIVRYSVFWGERRRSFQMYMEGGCLEIKATVPLVEEHVRQIHLGPKKSKVYENEDDDDISDHEEEFYYQEVAVDHMSSPPTMSHRDMARPPHENPEYQIQLRLEAVPVNTGNTESNGATAVSCVKE